MHFSGGGVSWVFEASQWVLVLKAPALRGRLHSTAGFWRLFCSEAVFLVRPLSCGFAASHLWKKRGLPGLSLNWEPRTSCAACSGDPTAFLFWPCRCSECQESLTNWYYEKDGKLYCHKDYWAKFGEFCHGCSLLVTGPAMVSCLSAPHRPPLTLSRSPWSVIIWYFHQEDDVLYQFIQP